MKVTSLLFCALLVFAVSAEMTDDEAVTYLNKVSQSNFGKTMLDTIMLQLQTNEPVSDLIDLLKDIQLQLETEQKQDDAYIKGVRGACDADEDRLNQEINAANSRIDELTGELNEKIPIRDEKSNLLAEKKDQANQISDRISELDQEKAERDADWQEVAAEHDRATYVIESAKQVLNGGFSGFLEKDQKVFAQLGVHFAKSSNMQFKRKSWAHLFKIMADISNAAPVQANREALNKILDLCDKLLEKIADSREIERRDYDGWVSEYQDTRAREVSKLEETDFQISVLQGEISALNKRISIAQDERDEQTNRLKQKKTELVEREKVCDDESENYAARRSDRIEDIGIVSECIGLIESKIRILRQFVAQRLG